MIKNRIIWVVIILILVILGILFLSFGDNEPINPEEVTSSRGCDKLAEQFAKENASTTTDLSYTWSVVRTLMDEESGTCYAELDKMVQVTSEGSSFSEYHIYDLTHSARVNSLTYFESDNYGSAEGEWEKYYEQKSPEYFEAREKIFGVGE